jgi:hypothetical protein
MPIQPAAPSVAGTLRPLARAISRAHIPAALKLVLLALLFACGVAVAPHAPRRAYRDWRSASPENLTAEEEAFWGARALRRIRRQRARIGWILRGLPGLGMAPSGKRAPSPSPTRAARAPPRPESLPFHPESVAKTPLPAAMTRAYRPGSRTRLNRASPSSPRRCAAICSPVTHQRNSPPSIGSPRLARKRRQ